MCGWVGLPHASLCSLPPFPEISGHGMEPYFPVLYFIFAGRHGACVCKVRSTHHESSARDVLSGIAKACTFSSTTQHDM
eukprot:4366742-Amphidinium_carterae.1